jgi:phospholipase/lecithinase/hemolysin
MQTRLASTRPKWIGVAAFCLMAVYCGGARGGGITGIVSFGDSLSDVGNDFIGSGGTEPSPPSDYYQGRFTNGGNWLDYLAKDLGVAAPIPYLAGGLNYAFGGASTGPGFTTFVPGEQVPNVDTQIGLYLASHTPSASQLFTIWAGANDLLLGNQSNPTVPAENIANEITVLAHAGARQFIVPNLPLLGNIPLTNTLSTSVRQGLDAWSIGFNQTLQSEVTPLEQSLGVQIHLVDIQGLLGNIEANPANYGFTNITGYAKNPSLAGNGYLFWDLEHPTTAADQIIGNLVAQSVPEPSSLIILATSIFGLGAWVTFRGRSLAS